LSIFNISSSALKLPNEVKAFRRGDFPPWK